MAQKQIRWLYAELPRLIEAEVLAPEAADRLKAHYGDVKPRDGRMIAVIICSIIGALLIGSGIILLMAHNWRGLPRPARVALALLILAGSEALAFFALCRKQRTAAWDEGVSVFNACAVAAAIALVGQTYHIPGDLGSFLLCWMLLVLPLVYLFRSTAIALLYTVGITFWSGYVTDEGLLWLWILPLFFALSPFIIREHRRNDSRVRSAVMEWVVVLCLPWVIGFAAGESVMEPMWCAFLASLYAIYYLAGSSGVCGSRPAWANPGRVLGSAATCVLAWLLTFEDVWDEIDLLPGVWGSGVEGGRVAIVALLLVALIALLVRAIRLKMWRVLLYGVAPMMVIVAQLLSVAADGLWPGLVVMNAYVLSLAVGTLTAGFHRGRLGLVNGGMVLLMALIVARFFDTELGFVVRGVVFILLGIGFLVTNIVVARRLKGGAA